ncbi:MAG: hypothetical protein E4G91_09610 [Candidatus Zixiibacteriota bacterium]|nr:MAG: hypothetical protein E4G91_09610 [candidate division Zixibacteria bacterium]
MKRSPHHNWHVPTILVLLAISLSLAIVGGCTSNALTPENGNPNQSKLDWLNEFFNDGGADRGPSPFIMEETVSGLIGPKGAVLQLNLRGSLPIVFRFPAGALKVETLITIHAYILQSPFGNFMLYDCGPDGTVFDVPVEVLQPEPRGTTTASLFYFNETSMQWELQETSRVLNGTALFHIYHFSKYGIS